MQDTTVSAKLFAAKCKELEEVLLEFDDFKSYFKATSKLYEQELESQLSELTHQYDHLLREDQKIKAELINFKRDQARLESLNTNLALENQRLKEDIRSLEGRVVGLENDLEQAVSQNRQVKTQLESLERQMQQDTEKFALLQVEFEAFQAESKRASMDLMEQLKEKEAEIQKMEHFKTPSKMLKPSISSNMSTRVSEFEMNATSSPRVEYFGTGTNALTGPNPHTNSQRVYGVQDLKNKRNPSGFCSVAIKREKGLEDRKSLRMIDDIIRNLEKNMQFFC